MALLAGTESGDEILFRSRVTLYERQIGILGRTPTKVARLVDNGFKYDLDAISKAITAKTRALIINSPENPTGYVCSLEEMKKLVEICQNAKVWLIHDEVYDQFAFDEPHTPASLLTSSADGVILVNSLSKKFGVPGSRIGWIASSEKLISAAAKSYRIIVPWRSIRPLNKSLNFCLRLLSLSDGSLI